MAFDGAEYPLKLYGPQSSLFYGLGRGTTDRTGRRRELGTPDPEDLPMRLVHPGLECEGGFATGLYDGCSGPHPLLRANGPSQGSRNREASPPSLRLGDGRTLHAQGIAGGVESGNGRLTVLVDDGYFPAQGQHGGRTDPEGSEEVRDGPKAAAQEDEIDLLAPRSANRPPLPVHLPEPDGFHAIRSFQSLCSHPEPKARSK